MLPWSTWRRPARPGDRRDDLGVAERRRGIVDRGLVGLDQRLLLRDQRALRVGLLLGAGVAGGELLVAGEVELLVGEQGHVLRLLGDGLVVLRLIDRGIDLAQHVVLLDVLALDEIHLEQLAVDLRAHGDRVQRASPSRRRRDRPARPATCGVAASTGTGRSGRAPAPRPPPPPCFGWKASQPR